nr:MAG TPA: hypothetical protein [Caudoviricetes sp.]
MKGTSFFFITSNRFLASVLNEWNWHRTNKPTDESL